MPWWAFVRGPDFRWRELVDAKTAAGFEVIVFPPDTFPGVPHDGRVLVVRTPMESELSAQDFASRVDEAEAHTKFKRTGEPWQGRY